MLFYWELGKSIGAMLRSFITDGFPGQGVLDEDPTVLARWS